MHRIPFRWKALTVILVACGLACLLAWSILLTSFCSHPRASGPQSQAELTYNCHGNIVVISAFEETLHHWLAPAGFAFIFLGLLAVAKGLIAAGAVRIQISVNVTDTAKQDRGSR